MSCFIQPIIALILCLIQRQCYTEETTFERFQGELCFHKVNKASRMKSTESTKSASKCTIDKTPWSKSEKIH